MYLVDLKGKKSHRFPNINQWNNLLIYFVGFPLYLHVCSGWTLERFKLSYCIVPGAWFIPLSSISISRETKEYQIFYDCTFYQLELLFQVITRTITWTYLWKSFELNKSSFDIFETIFFDINYVIAKKIVTNLIPLKFCPITIALKRRTFTQNHYFPEQKSLWELIKLAICENVTERDFHWKSLMKQITDWNE